MNRGLDYAGTVRISAGSRTEDELTGRRMTEWMIFDERTNPS
jgi:hypothetical protein